MKNIKNKDCILFIIAFIIPVIFMSIAYKLIEAYPFGEKSVLSMDLWGQYYPMIKGLWYDMKDFTSSHYSWDGGLGFNLYAQTLYYCNSIFFRLLFFAGSAYIIQAIDIVLLIKYGFYSVAFLAFLKYKYKEINCMSVAFAIAYSLCSYNLAYLNQPMWTDCIIYFPVIIIGIERLVKEKKPVLYTLILGLSLYSSFYITFSICIFSVIYFIVTVVVSDLNKNDILSAIKRFMGHSLLAGGIVAFSLLAILMAIQNRNPDHTTIEELKLYHSLYDIAKSMFMNTKLSYEYFVPNIYSGLFVIPFIGLYFGNRNIKIKNKIIFAVLFVFLIFSFNFNVLDYVWHGFHFPNQLPGRWTFIFSFVMLIVAYEGIRKTDKIDIIQAFGAIICFLIIYILGINTSVDIAELADSKNYTIGFGIAYIAIICLMSVINDFTLKNIKIKKIIQNTLYGIAVVAVIAEMGINTGYCGQKWIRSGELEHNYFFDESMDNIRENILDKDTDLYRTEMNTGWTFNPGLLYDYRGISYYSSTMHGATYNMLDSLGNRVYAKNVSSIYNSENNVLNSIFGVKYVIDRVRNIDMSCYNLIDVEKDYNVIINKNCLPLAFPVNDDLLQWNKNDIGPLQLQNEFIKKALGNDKEEAFTQINATKADVSNATLINNENWHENYYLKSNANQPVTFNYSFVCDKDSPYYIQHNFKAGDVIINAAGREYTVNSSSPVKYIGKLKKGDTVNVSVSIDNQQYALYNIELFRFNMDEFSDMASRLKVGGLDVDEFTDTDIKGKVNSKNDNQLFFTSIPDDGGWSVYCDGEKLETEKISDALIAFRTPVGEHDIELVYNVRGYKVGVAIAAVSWIILIYANYKEKLLKLCRKEKYKNEEQR